MKFRVLASLGGPCSPYLPCWTDPRSLSQWYLRLVCGGALFALAVVVGNAGAANCVIPVGGDPIGADSSLTDGTGGFTAVLDEGENKGQPAILVSLDGDEQLRELRVIAFGASTVGGALRFDQFEYQMEIWPSSQYFTGADPSYRIELGTPANWTLVSQTPNRVVPETPFGTTGEAGDDAATYDMAFDLARLPPQLAGDLFSDPLPAGDWVFAFQSMHSTSEHGTLRVAGSVAEGGPLPLFSRGTEVPRGILGNQDPEQVFLRWGMSLSALDESHVHGDFNQDGQVGVADYTVWRNGLGTDYGVDDYECWKSAFYDSLGQKLQKVVTESSAALTSQIPESSTCLSAGLLTSLVLAWRMCDSLQRCRCVG